MRYFSGKWQSDKRPLTVLQVNEICDKASECRKQMADYPLDKILSLLEMVGEKWRNPDYKYRKEAEKLLPAEIGFSKEMIDLGINEVGAMLNAEVLKKKIATEFGGIPRISEHKYNFETQTALQWRPIGVILHVLAGNVFLVGIMSLIEGLITGNVNILKMSSGEKVFLPLFIKSLKECDKEGFISNSIALIDYSSSQKDIMAEFKKRADGIAVWGGEAAIKGYRNDLGAGTKLIVFGPKISFAAISKKGMSSNKMEDMAEKLALDISIWDQNACTAPQVCYVEGKKNAELFSEKLALAMKKISVKLPSGETDMASAIEIQKMRSLFEISEIKGEGVLKESPKGLDWTIVVDKNKVLEPSPLNRTIRIIPFTNIGDVIANTDNLRGYVQTVGLSAGDYEKWNISKELIESGALRVVDIGKMGGGEVDDPHDGAYNLREWMNIVLIRVSGKRKNIHPIDEIPADEKNAIINSRLRELIEKARKSEFYGKRLKKIKIETTDDLVKIPMLTRPEMEKNMPPQGNGLSTGDYSGGYVSRSGGSTGIPKFSIYDNHDWDHMIDSAVRIFRAMGIKKTDRLANFMIAGDLYGSFISFDHINFKIGVTSFGFSTNTKPEVFLDMWKKFNINVAQMIPSIGVPYLREVKKLDPSFTIEKVMYAGTPMSKTDYDWIKSELGAKTICSVIGANDGGAIAFQCEEMSGAVHHTIDDYNYIEIVDEKGERVPDGTQGRILITSLLKHAFPLIRYDIGDSGRIINKACSCGRTNRILEYMGRADDIITLGILNLKFQDIKSALKSFPLSEIQVAAKNNEKGEYIVIRTETSEPMDDLKAKIHKKLLVSIPRLKQQLEAKCISKLEIEMRRPGLLKRHPRSGKVKTLLDERK